MTRPSHLFIKILGPSQPKLTTQLYFEGDSYINNNVKDPLIMKINKGKDTKKANFDFVMEYYNEYTK
ncbi:MAG: hypothetical protein ACM31H_00335 [Nitrososphaerales archaeon]